MEVGVTVIFPDRPTVHGVPSVFKIADDISWRPPARNKSGGLRTTWRECSYCGSAHPDDLMRMIADGSARMSGSDWKYGWPHKFYLHVKNPEADREVEVGATYKDGVSVPMMGKRDDLFGKFYSEHFEDEGFDDEARAALSKAVLEATGIEFTIGINPKTGRTALRYRSPCHGYQR